MVHFFYTLPWMLLKKLMLATCPWRAAMRHAAQLRCTPCCGGCSVLPQAAPICFRIRRQDVWYFYPSIRWIPLKSRMCNARFPESSLWNCHSKPLRSDTSADVSGWLENSRFLQDSMRGVFVRFGILASFSVSIDGEERLQDEKGMLGLRLGNKQKARLFTASLKSQVFCICGGSLMVPWLNRTRTSQEETWLEFPNCKSYYFKCSQKRSRNFVPHYLSLYLRLLAVCA